MRFVGTFSVTDRLQPAAGCCRTDHHAYFIKTTPYGERIRADIDPDGIYYVVTDSYTSDYAPNNMTVIETYDPGVFARDLVAAYFAED